MGEILGSKVPSRYIQHRVNSRRGIAGLSCMFLFEALVGCHDILILGRSPMKWRQRPGMTIAVDWDFKFQFKQIIKQITG